MPTDAQKAGVFTTKIYNPFTTTTVTTGGVTSKPRQQFSYMGVANQIDPSSSNSISEITCVGSFTMELLSVKRRALCNSIILFFSVSISVVIAGVIVFIIRVR